jgi:hypothetical protein
MLIVTLGCVRVARAVSSPEDFIDFRQSWADGRWSRLGRPDDRHLNHDLLALGHAGVFVEFDGPAADLAVDRLGHGWLLLFVIVLSHFTWPLLRIRLLLAAVEGERKNSTLFLLIHRLVAVA